MTNNKGNWIWRPQAVTPPYPLILLKLVAKHNWLKSVLLLCTASRVWFLSYEPHYIVMGIELYIYSILRSFSHSLMVYYFCLWKRRCKRIGCISFLVLEVLAASWVSCTYDAGIRILGMVWCDEAAVLILPNRNKGSPILCHEWCRSLLALPHAQHTTQNQVTGEVHHWSRISSLFLIYASLTLNYFPLS